MALCSLVMPEHMHWDRSDHLCAVMREIVTETVVASSNSCTFSLYNRRPNFYIEIDDLVEIDKIIIYSACNV